MENIKSLLKKARSGSVEAQKELLVQFVSQSQEVISLMNDDDKSWLMPLAQERNIYAICYLNYGTSHKFEHWVEAFKDEETGEDISMDRYNSIDGSTFTLSDEEKKMLWEQIRGVEKLSENEIWALRYSDFLYNHNLVKELYDKHTNALLALYLAENFYYGAEEQGVFVDKEKAKYYYDLAGEETPEEDDEDDELGDICSATFNIDGDETQIKQVAELIENLTAQYGTPDNEFGLYLPIRHLIEKITGSVAYEGNIISCKKNNQEGLEVMVETNSNGAYALKWALQRGFPHTMVHYI